MKYERSYGIIPLRRVQEEWMLLLVQHQNGYWAFPKGHPEPHESPQQTATRELFEETGLQVEQILSSETLKEIYYFTFQGQKIHKQVDYFLALVQGEVIIQELEIQNSAWVRLQEAEEKMTFSEGKKICQKTKDFLKTYPS